MLYLILSYDSKTDSVLIRQKRQRYKNCSSLALFLHNPRKIQRKQLFHATL